MLVAGVDVGSTQTKAVILNENSEIVARGILNTDANIVKAAEKARPRRSPKSHPSCTQ